jgi:hypothetical protein
MLASYALFLAEDTRRWIGEVGHLQWLELDHLLVRLRESHSTRLRMLYDPAFDPDGWVERNRMEVLLPELVARGEVDFVGVRGQIRGLWVEIRNLSSEDSTNAVPGVHFT